MNEEVQVKEFDEEKEYEPLQDEDITELNNILQLQEHPLSDDEEDDDPLCQTFLQID